MKESKLISVLIPLSFLFYLAVNIISWNFPFFWDTLLTSSIVSYFYDNGLNGFIIPEKLDAGHPPLFYLYILGWWKLSFPSLTISHLAMLPVLWTIVYQYVRLSGYFIKKPVFLIGCVLLLLVDPGILAQSTLISYDMVILMFYLMALRAILIYDKFFIVLSTILLPLISIRGSFALGALMASHLAIGYIYNKKWEWKKMIYYIPAILAMILWHGYHYMQTGWLFFSPSENWISHRESGTFNLIIHNLLTIIRNHLDYGKIGVCAGIFFLIVLWIVKKNKFSNDMKVLIAITIIPLIVFSLLFLPFSNPIGHRYYLVVYALSFILFIYLLTYFERAKILFLSVWLVLISGHFWIYNSISNGWDSTTAHIPYFQLKKQVNNYITKNIIDKTSIASKFPLHVSEKQEYLEKDSSRISYWSSKGDFEYVLFSNISNEWTYEELEKIKQMDTVLYLEKRKIYITLLQVNNKSELPPPSDF